MSTRFLFLIFFTPLFGLADNVSNSLLSGKGSGEEPSKSGLESGRYQQKKNGTEEEIKLPKKTNKNPTGQTSKKKNDPGKFPASEEMPKAEKVEDGEAAAAKEFKEPPIADQVKDIFNGKSEKSGEAYRDQVHPDDVRLNKIEINFSSGMMGNTATANYAYRKYSSTSSFLNVGANLWLTPVVGVGGSYMSSFGEDIPATSNANNRVAVKSEWFELSFDFRKFYGVSRRANSVQYGFIYNEWKFNVPPDDTSRVKLKTAGVGFYVRARIPVAPGYSWIFGGEVLPFINHSESATGLNMQSGTSVETNRIGVFVGGEFKFSRQNQIVWTLGLKSEKNQFAGSANKVDPETGAAPSGVSVNNNWTYFNLGYRWGQ